MPSYAVLFWHGKSYKHIEENMRLTKNQFQFVVNSNVETIVSYLQEEAKIPVLDAFDMVYNSRTYRKLADSRTGLYLQSADYIYDY